MKLLKQNGSGILICSAIAGISTILSSFSIGTFNLEIIGAPVFSILIGMLLTLIMPDMSKSDKFKNGITFTSKKILQWAVIILGFSLNLGTIAKVGTKSMPIIISTILTSLIVAMIMMKVMKIDKKIACLIGVGSSICGGSAIAATAPVIDADDAEIAQAISVIFLFNVLAALIFPMLGYKIGLGSEGFAIFAGTAVNDTSSVTAAASTAEGIYGINGILSSAVIIKLTRTLAIIPITLILAFIRTKGAEKSGRDGKKISIKQIFPFFIIYFVIASLITTLVGIMPESTFTVFYNESLVVFAKWFAKFFIAMAMSAIGLNTNIVTLIKKGGKPIALGFCCWAAITGVCLAMQLMTNTFGANL